MTIAASTSYQQFTRNGVTTQWSYNNKIFAAADLAITDLDQSVPPVLTVLVLNTDYTISNVDVDTGCLITTTVPGTNGHILDVRSVTPKLQSTSIKNQGSFFPELHEEFFDRATRMLQDLYRQTYTFGVHGPDIEVTPWTALPAAALRAGLLLAFDSNGLPTLASSVAMNWPLGGNGVIQIANYTLQTSDSGKQVQLNGSSLALNIPNPVTPFPIGFICLVENVNSSAMTVTTSADTLILAGTTTSGTRTIAQNGRGTLLKRSAGIWTLDGPGVT